MSIKGYSGVESQLGNGSRLRHHRWKDFIPDLLGGISGIYKYDCHTPGVLFAKTIPPASSDSHRVLRILLRIITHLDGSAEYHGAVSGRTR